MSDNEIYINREDLSGPTGAFKSAFLKYYQALCFFADKILQDKSVAEDTVENVFIRLWERKRDFDENRNIKALLFISVKNACLDLIKKRRTRRVKDDALSYLLSQESEDFILNEIIRAEVLREIHEEMQKLPPECRKVMQFYFVEGLNYKDIAAQLDISISTVKNQKARGVKVLKGKFGRNFFLLLSYSAPLIILPN